MAEAIDLCDSDEEGDTEQSPRIAMKRPREEEATQDGAVRCIQK